MVKVLFLINTLGGGGAEKVLVNLVNNMDKTKFDTTVETMFDDGVNAELLDKNIRYISKKAFCPRGIAYIFRMIPSTVLYKYFVGNEKYDILVAYMHGAPVKVIDGCPDSNVKKIAWLHNGNPETGTFFDFWWSKKKAFRGYENCHAVAGVSKTVADAFVKYTGIKNNSFVVYNTNDCSKILSNSNENTVKRKDSYINIVSVGRLGKEKGFDRLISVVARLKKEKYDVSLTIVGDGSLKDELLKQIENLGCGDYVSLAGFKSNPYPYVKNANLFVCSSYTEGLSTAVTEAVILGKPVVSTDVSGAKEILGYNNEFGIVTDNDEDALYEGIKKMILTEGLLEYYGEKAKERAEFFSTEKTVKQAEDLFISVLK